MGRNKTEKMHQVYKFPQKPKSARKSFTENDLGDKKYTDIYNCY